MPGHSCGKQRFTTGAQARAALHMIRKRGWRTATGKKPTDPYPCGFCGGWHLTGQAR